jgi:hypothetical protein
MNVAMETSLGVVVSIWATVAVGQEVRHTMSPYSHTHASTKGTSKAMGEKPAFPEELTGIATNGTFYYVQEIAGVLVGPRQRVAAGATLKMPIGSGSWFETREYRVVNVSRDSAMLNIPNTLERKRVPLRSLRGATGKGEEGKTEAAGKVDAGQ